MIKRQHNVQKLAIHIKLVWLHYDYPHISYYMYMLYDTIKCKIYKNDLIRPNENGNYPA